MLADDMGYDDMSLRGNNCVETPNLNNFARQSTSFDNFYVHSVSAPTRASLLTGRHFLRTGISGVHAGRDFLNLDEVTIAEAFQQAGYTTGMWGKWHSGKTSGYYPWERGFDEAYMATLYHYLNNVGLLNGETLKTEGWVDAVITDMAIEFIEENKDEPFFAYIPFLSPHGVWSAPESYVNANMEKGQSRSFATLNGMINHLDVQVGRILEAVEEKGLADNTIIIFMCDNGPIKSAGDMGLTNEEWRQRNPSEYRGNKGQNFDNGIHSPLFVYWKGHYESAENSSLLAVYDLFPTLCDIADVEIPQQAKQMDGVSFRSILEDPTKCERDRSIFISQWTPFFAYHDTNNENQALPLTLPRRASIDANIQMIGMRKGDYKLLLNQWGADDISLWNLKEDYKESKNIAQGTNYKDITEAYKDATIAWYKGVLSEEGSYQMPTFQIGLEESGMTQIMCYAPIEFSEDGLLNTNHVIKGFDKVGEKATYKVNVIKDGKYALGIRAQGRLKGDAQFRISTNLDDDCGVVTLNGSSSSFQSLTLTNDVTTVSIELITPTQEELSLSSIDILYK